MAHIIQGLPIDHDGAGQWAIRQWREAVLAVQVTLPKATAGEIIAAVATIRTDAMSLARFGLITEAWAEAQADKMEMSHG